MRPTSGWRPDGPTLPLEFVRDSDDSDDSDAIDHLDQFTVGVGTSNLVAAGGFDSHGADAPPAIRSTRELKESCPASAGLMARSLSNLDADTC